MWLNTQSCNLIFFPLSFFPYKFQFSSPLCYWHQAVVFTTICCLLTWCQEGQWPYIVLFSALIHYFLTSTFIFYCSNNATGSSSLIVMSMSNICNPVLSVSRSVSISTVLPASVNPETLTKWRIRSAHPSISRWPFAQGRWLAFYTAPAV